MSLRGWWQCLQCWKCMQTHANLMVETWNSLWTVVTTYNKKRLFWWCHWGVLQCFIWGKKLKLLLLIKQHSSKLSRCVAMLPFSYAATGVCVRACEHPSSKKKKMLAMLNSWGSYMAPNNIDLKTWKFIATDTGVSYMMVWWKTVSWIMIIRTMILWPGLVRLT